MTNTMSTNAYQKDNGEITVIESYDGESVFLTVLDKSPGASGKPQTVILSPADRILLKGLL